MKKRLSVLWIMQIDRPDAAGRRGIETPGQWKRAEGLRARRLGSEAPTSQSRKYRGRIPDFLELYGIGAYDFARRRKTSSEGRRERGHS